MELRLRHPALRLLAVGALLLLVAPPALGQALTPVAASGPAPHRISAAASVDCADGLVYDDGDLEEAILFRDLNTGAGLSVDAVMRFDVGQADVPLEQICVCWNRDGLDPVTTFDHEIVFFTADEPGGQPGALIASLPFTLVNVPGFPLTAFVSYDLTTEDIRTTSGSIYAGVRWTSGDEGQGSFVLCTDQDGSGQQPMYAALAGSGEWLSTDDLFSHPDVEIEPPTALMIRLEPLAPPPVCPQEPCVEDDFTLCLNDGRFKVTAHFLTAPNQSDQSQSGEAHVERLTPDTGYLWFFQDSNVEVVVKVLDACQDPFNRFWVFAGGLTNVQVEMEVCDTEKGVLQTYTNPLRTPFQPLQDTDAFATCP